MAAPSIPWGKTLPVGYYHRTDTSSFVTYRPRPEEYQLTTGLASASAAFHRSANVSEFHYWQDHFFDRFQNLQGLAQLLLLPLVIGRGIKAVTPRVIKKIATRGITHPGASFLISTGSLALIVSAITTVSQRLFTPPSQDQNLLSDFKTNLIYILPSMFLGMGAMQIGGFGARLWQDLLVLGPLQSVISACTTIKLQGDQPGSEIHFNERLMIELAEGGLSMLTGRATGSLMHRGEIQRRSYLKPIPEDYPIKPDLKPYYATWVYDGDSLLVQAIDDPEPRSTRFELINTTEAGYVLGSPERRCRYGDPGAHGAYQFLQKLTAEYGNVVYLKVYEVDKYNRPVATVFLKGHDGRFIDVNLALIEAGWAHTYIYEPNESRGLTPYYLEAQKRAQAARRGIWNDRSFREFFITGFRMTERGGDPQREYFGFCNLSADRSLNLRGYRARQTFRDASGRVAEVVHSAPFPDMLVPPARQTYVYARVDPTGKHATRTDPAGRLIINLGHEESVWDPRFPIELVDPIGDLVSSCASTVEASTIPRNWVL
ncbi:MAG: thermonuclease family protein [Deltaproteobacteria bacterium]|nr:thermonuclease family protein [Deltaproteobacteria bacterium]MBI4373854.1 thermonuclease family protein [Deltaproteobacteria bacterium]